MMPQATFSEPVAKVTSPKAMPKAVPKELKAQDAGSTPSTPAAKSKSLVSKSTTPASASKSLVPKQNSRPKGDDQPSKKDDEKPVSIKIETNQCERCFAQTFKGQIECDVCGLMLEGTNKADKAKIAERRKAALHKLGLYYDYRGEYLQSITHHQLESLGLLDEQARGSSSPEADLLKRAKSRYERDLSLGYISVTERFTQDATFAESVLNEGENEYDCQRNDMLRAAHLPKPSRTKAQVKMGISEQSQLEHNAMRLVYLDFPSRRDMPSSFKYIDQPWLYMCRPEVYSEEEYIDYLKRNPQHNLLLSCTGVDNVAVHDAERHLKWIKGQNEEAAANALLGAYHHINPYLACLCLSKHIQDPLLYVVTVALRSVRRLFAIQKPLAHDFVKRTESFDACVTYGPASSLSKYLEKMGLWMTKEALVCSEDGLVCDVQFSSGKEIKLAMSRYWSKFVFSEVIDRKGIPNDEVNVSVQLSVFSSLTDAEQKLIALNVTGGFQTNAIKKKWNEDVEVQCNFCEQFDNRAHRLLTCTATSVTRDQHMDAVGILTNEYPDWQYLPLATHVEDTNVFLMAMQAIKLPKPDPAMIVHATHHIYYTDGGCIFPQIADARISSWAVVRDFALGEEHALAMTKNAIDLSKPCPLMRCVEMGLTQGRQTISRGELCAIIVACESASLDDQLQVLDLYTDSQYAINVIHFICMGHIYKWGYKIANFDLVLRLSQVWDTRKFRAHKVKSHLDWTAQTSLSYARKIMGNFVADRLATLALKRCPRWMKQMSEAIASHRNHQKEKLQKVFRYMVDLSKQRRKLETEKIIPQHQSQSVASCRNLMCDDAVEIFYRYHIVNGLQVSLDFYDSPNLQGSLQGVNLARLILKWAESITWPTPDHNWGPQQDLAAAMSWGVSWSELFINFAITTGCFMPVRVAGSLEHVQFTEYFSETARILPSDRRSAMNQATSFQSACRCVESILRVKLFPDFVTKGGKAIHRFGFTGQVAGVMPRPMLLRQNETIQTVFQYIRTSPNKKKLRQSLDGMITYSDLTVPPVHEPTAATRFKAYKMIYKRRSVE